jgi:hypothetical protein
LCKKKTIYLPIEQLPSEDTLYLCEITYSLKNGFENASIYAPEYEELFNSVELCAREICAC